MFQCVHHVRILVHDADAMVQYMAQTFAMTPVKVQVYTSRGMKNGCVPPFTHDVFARAVRLARHPCFVNPAMESPPRLLSQCAVLPAGRRSCSEPIWEAPWPWAHSAAILSAAYPVARLWGRRG